MITNYSHVRHAQGAAFRRGDPEHKGDCLWLPTTELFIIYTFYLASLGDKRI